MVLKATLRQDDQSPEKQPSLLGAKHEVMPTTKSDLPFINLHSVYDKGREEWIRDILESGVKFGDGEFSAKMTELVAESKNFLGFGGCSAVINIGGQCVKIVRNRWKKKSDMYNLGRSPNEEFKIQSAASELIVDGVFTPKVFGCEFSENMEFAAIYMERLDAQDLQQIFSGRVKAPDFDPEQVFAEIQAYIYTLHDEYNIVHGDLAPRNVMLDSKTGKPRIIDFGRALHFKSRPSNFDQLAKVDERELAKLEKELLNFKKPNK